MFNFEKQLKEINETKENYEAWLRENGVEFEHYNEEDKQKIFILQETIIQKNSSLGLGSEAIADAVTNLSLNW